MALNILYIVMNHATCQSTCSSTICNTVWIFFVEASEASLNVLEASKSSLLAAISCKFMEVIINFSFFYANQHFTTSLAENLSDDLQKEGFKGKTLTLKLKTADFEVRTRAVTTRNYIDSKEDILVYATKLIKAEMPISLRLMGLRMSQLHDEKDDPSTSTQKTLDIFFRSSNSNSNGNGTTVQRITNSPGQDNDSISLTTKEEYLAPDAGTSVSTGQQDFFLHDEICFIPEQQRSLDNDTKEAVLSDPLGGTKSDDVSSSAKVTPTKKLDEPDPLISPKAVSSSSKPDQQSWIDGYICSICGFELPPGFEEERLEHSDFHLAETLQQEEAVDGTRHISNESWVAERPRSTAPTPKKKLKSSKEGKHIPIDSFFTKCNKSP
ncbi:DNA/RNA polymerases superfamily protein [Zea mays]|uniref:DNA-directed DNA polymerase n=1 Tax=Zea mays TaxID=4577 RepID=A0A1D6GLR3_MAIZE|nr:DNA/RNA polymerases superfamily protein [Zea mays]